MYLLLLISMLWQRQAIFKSKGDKLCCSAECRIWTLCQSIEINNKYVCTCVCTYVCMYTYICMYVWLYVCMIWISLACARASKLTTTNKYVCMHTHICMYLNTGSGNVDIFKVKLTVEMLTTAFIFDPRMGVLVKMSKFLKHRMSRSEGDSNPQPFGFMPNALIYWAIRARHLLSHVFEYWLWRCAYFRRKVNISYFNCARATAFIFDTRMGVLVKLPACTTQ